MEKLKPYLAKQMLFPQRNLELQIFKYQIDKGAIHLMPFKLFVSSPFLFIMPFFLGLRWITLMMRHIYEQVP